jgi:polar amino acid transport system substrate-binding protein
MKWSSILTVFYLPVLFFASHANANDTIRFCEDPWPPYTFGETGSAPTGGYAVDFLNEIASRLTLNISMELLPWKRCLLMAKKGQVDGVMLITKSGNRERYLDFSIPLMSDNNLVWFRRGDNIGSKVNSFAELKNYRIGVAASFNYGDEFNEASEHYKFNIEEARDIESNFKKLVLGRIDVFFVNLSAANEVFRENPSLAKKVTYVDKLFDKVPFYIAFSKKSKEKTLLPLFNKTIQEMLKEGAIDRILENRY